MDIEPRFMENCTDCKSSDVCRGILFLVYGETGKKKAKFNEFLTVFLYS